MFPCVTAGVDVFPYVTAANGALDPSHAQWDDLAQVFKEGCACMMLVLLLVLPLLLPPRLSLLARACSCLLVLARACSC